ncbi:hypothetical protein [Endozoicomonas sp. ONNA1]|uniref:hypothetical protein n=1 Tax=Endozoicomonas sp. ONNA1 TaxID=2828740 RepID=UPI0021473A19|nr:hypothetical protein [Endozoicomonas sp. ONNA1]
MTDNNKPDDIDNAQNTLDDGKEPNVELSSPCKTPRPKDAKADPNFTNTLSLPMKTIRQTNKALEELPSLTAGGEEAMGSWLQVYTAGFSHYQAGGSFEDSLNREGSAWRQNVKAGEMKMGIVKPRVAASADGAKLSGDSALFKIGNALGLGGTLKFPLWHSGIWLSIKDPGESPLLAMERKIAEQKIVLGRQSNGIAFSSVNVYTRRWWLEVAFSSIYDATYTNRNMKALMKVIKITDAPLIAWGLLCTIHPNGFNLAQACVADIHKCQHVVEELVNLSKLCWTDNNMLSDDQKQFMSDRDKRHNFQDIEKYQKQFSFNNHDKIQINENLYMTFKVPTIEEYLVSGERWVDSIVDVVERGMGSGLSDAIKDQYISEQGRATTLRQYAAWIDKLYIDEGEGNFSIVEDRETIDLACDRFSAQKDICDLIFKEIGKFIDLATFSIIGIPTYNCPACEKPQTDQESKYPTIIPLDIEETFFTLVRLKVIEIINRTNSIKDPIS